MANIWERQLRDGTGLFDVGAVFEGLAEPSEEAEDNDDEGHGGWVFLGYG